MPDLITHLTLNNLIFKLFKKKSSLLFILFGGIFPDFFSAAYIILIDIFHFNDPALVTAVEAVGHSLFSGLIFAFVLGTLTRDKKIYICSFFLGYSLHLLLDIFQNNWGNGILIFYPFSFKPFSFKLFTYGIEFKYYYSFILLIVLVAAFSRQKEEIILDLRIKKIFLSLGLLLFLIAADLIFLNKTINNNIFFIDLQYHPQKYHDKVIEMCKVRFSKTEPPVIKFRKHELLIKNIPDIKISKKYVYNIEGIFDYNKKSISVTKIVSFIPQIKAYISAIALIIFLFYFIFRVKIKIITYP